MSAADFPSTNYSCNREKRSTSYGMPPLVVVTSSTAALHVQDLLAEANACAQSSVEVGASILSDLNNQRENLVNVNGSMQGATGTLQVRQGASDCAPCYRLFAAFVNDRNRMFKLRVVAAHAAAHHATDAHCTRWNIGCGRDTTASCLTPHRRALS
jgi:hypothetical protein|tara:strand:- start:561 stop:1028 length:468 start_codon:yes stop_codon:yes gene_type:complete